MTGNCHVRCGAGENSEMISKNYLSLFGQIPKFDKLIATIRSREISASIILQSKSQLKAIYKDNADTIEGNCDTMLFLGGKEKSTLKEISESLGKETIDSFNTSTNRGQSESYGMNYQKLGKELKSQDELAVMDGGKCILQVRGVRPFLRILEDLPFFLRIVDDLMHLVRLHLCAEVDRVTAVFVAFKDMGNRVCTPAVCFCVVSAVIPALRESVGGRCRDTLFGLDTGNLHRTVAVNAELENLAYHLSGRLINYPQVLVGIRFLVAVHGRTQVLARLTFSPEHRTNLLTAITGVPVIEDIFERKQFVFGLRRVNIIVDGNVTHIIVGEHHLDQFTRFQVVTTEP